MQNGNAQNVTEPDFRKKKIFGTNLGQKQPKNRVFWTLCKITSLVFSDFWQKDRGQGCLKGGWSNFSPENFYLSFNMDFCIWGNSLLPFFLLFLPLHRLCIKITKRSRYKKAHPKLQLVVYQGQKMLYCLLILWMLANQGMKLYVFSIFLLKS